MWHTVHDSHGWASRDTGSKLTHLRSPPGAYSITMARPSLVLKTSWNWATWGCIMHCRWEAICGNRVPMGFSASERSWIRAATAHLCVRLGAELGPVSASAEPYEPQHVCRRGSWIPCRPVLAIKRCCTRRVQRV